MDETPRKQAKTPSAPIKKGAPHRELAETDTKRKLFDDVQEVETTPVQKKGKLNGLPEDVVPVVARRTRFIQKNQDPENQDHSDDSSFSPNEWFDSF